MCLQEPKTAKSNSMGNGRQRAVMSLACCGVISLTYFQNISGHTELYPNTAYEEGMWWPQSKSYNQDWEKKKKSVSPHRINLDPFHMPVCKHFGNLFAKGSFKRSLPWWYFDCQSSKENPFKEQAMPGVDKNLCSSSSGPRWLGHSLAWSVPVN